MSDPDTKFRRSQSRRRNFIAKTIRETGDNKGAFALKIVPPKKEYKRVKSNSLKRMIENDEFDEETD